MADDRGVNAGRALHALTRLPAREQVHDPDIIRASAVARGRALAAARRGDKTARDALAAAEHDDTGGDAA
jgi:hypothetical protein